MVFTGHKRCRTNKRKNPIFRFINKIQKTRSCWLWNGSKGESGHGQFCFDYKRVQAHRFMYVLGGKKIPKGMFVCHKCNVPHCVNPEHLYLADNKTNIRDAARDGLIPRGEKCFRSKLKRGEVRHIREMHAEGATMGALAIAYKVTTGAISGIIARRSWAWL